MSSTAYSALGVDADDPTDSSAVAASTPSSIALSFAAARAAAAARRPGAGDARGFLSAGAGYQAEDAGGAGVDKGALLGTLRRAGLGGMGTAALDADTRKFRWDKPSRLVRMQRGTKCYRFTLLVLSVIIVFSGYFQFDLPAITVNQLLAKLNINMEQYATIFVGYSVSNTIVPLFSGAFFGKFGKWRGVTLIAVTITLGIAVVWVGMLAKSYNVVVLGRTIYGLGGESVFVGVDILVTKWFQGAEIGFAYGLIQAAGQAGSFTALYSVPPLVTAFGGEINQVYLISFCLSCTALGCLALARLIEKTAYGAKKVASAALSGDEALLASFTGKAGTHAGDAERDAAAKKAAAAGAKAKGGAGERASLLAGGGAGAGGEGADGGAGGAARGADEDAEEEEEVEGADTDVESPELRARLEHNLRFLKCVPPLYHAVLFLGFGHLTTLGWRFYAVMGGIICYSSAFYTFLAFGPKWLMTNYGLTEDAAGQTAGIIAIFSMIVSPSSGLVMDARGGQRYVCFIAMVSACCWFAIMGFANAPPAMCIVFAGMSYSLLPASLYPLLPEVVPAESFTIVYAVLNSAINFVFTMVLLIAGRVLGQDTADLAALGPPGTRGLAAAFARAATGAAATAARAAQAAHDDAHDAGGVAPEQFKYVFTMFIVITFVGVLCTGTLAYDAYKHGTGWMPLASHH